MTIHYSTDSTELSVYFHMKNHYKRLRNVKSTIDNSTPQGFGKSFSTPPNSERSWKTCSYEERHIRNCSHLPNHTSAVKRHSCIASAGTKSETSIRSASLPPRPKTRRHPYEMPNKLQCKSRSQSVGPTSRKDVVIGPRNDRVKKKKQAPSIKDKIQEDEIEKEEIKKEVLVTEEGVQCEVTSRSNNSQQTARSNDEKIVSKSRTEEHEYLQFLLRITEDIIVNNLYATEDIEKVFQNHIEANRDRLKMAKMQAQLDKLCMELNMPCKITQNDVNKSGDCYLHFFENNNSNNLFNVQDFDNCECASKRTLTMEVKECKTLHNIVEEKERQLENNFQIEDGSGQNRLNMLISKHSLGRVTECTEPTTSLGTLSNSTVHPSVTTICSFEYVDVLPCFENFNVESRIEKGGCNKYEEFSENQQQENCNKEPPLTEKEKLGCMEEEILFDKYNCNSTQNSVNSEALVNKLEAKDSENVNFNKETPYNGDEIEKEIKNVSELSEIFINKERYLYKEQFRPELKENSFICLSNIEQSLNEIVLKLGTSTHEFIQKTVDATPVASDRKINTSDCIIDKCIQASVAQCDKECNTNEMPMLEQYSQQGDYILINSPVYVLKAALESNEKLIICDDHHVINRGIEALPEKLLHNDIRNFSCLDSVHPTESKPDTSYFSKLLNSDYDLTPQRDENTNTSEKYHHLLKDATTSVANLSVNMPEVVNLNPIGLLLTEKYSLSNIKEKEATPCCVENQTDEKTFSNFVLNSELSLDGQYEIKSYTLPNEGNGSVILSGYAFGGRVENDIPRCDRELDVSIAAYEIRSDTNDLYKQESQENVYGEASESGEVVKRYVDDSSSQMSSVRSETNQSSTSSNCNSKNILGKRKLEHPG